MNRSVKTRKNNICTLNIAWNKIVQDLIDRGAYNKFIYSDQSKIAVTFFGTVPGISWNGGRLNSRIGTMSVDELIKSVLWLNKRNIGFNFTFNTTLINDSCLKDHLPNKVLQACRSSLNGVVCASTLLGQYLKDKYPEYERIVSSILSPHHIKELEKLFEQFDVIVLPENLNPNFYCLKRLHNLEKIEMILNSSCIYKCPFRDKHAQLIHEDLLREMQGKKAKELPDPCVEMFKHKHDWVVDNEELTVDKQFIFPEMLPAYIELGIRRFKLLDRTQPPELDELLDYWVMLHKCLKQLRPISY